MTYWRRRANRRYFSKNAAGKYVYSGAYYRYDTPERPRKRALRELWVCCILAAAAGLAAGCVPAPGLTKCAYVMIPYLVGLVAACSMIWSVGQLAAGGDPLREDVYDTTVKRLPRRAAVTGAADGLAVLGEAIYLVRVGAGENAASAAVFLALELAAVLAALGIVRRMGKTTWTKFQKPEE